MKKMDSFIFSLFAFVYIVLLIWLLWKHAKTASIILVFVIIALIYDNVILAVGDFIGEGELLKILSAPRFWLHALFTPFLIIFSYFVLAEARIPFAQKTWVAILFIVGTIVAIIMEYVLMVKDLSLKVTDEYGVISYTSATESSGPPVMMIIVIAALVVAAIVLAWKRKWWWMLVGLILMAVGGAIAPFIESNAVTNLSELCLVITLVSTAIHFSHEKKTKVLAENS
jgi:hypothetical protein